MEFVVQQAVGRRPAHIDLPEFCYAEECGLSLFKHRKTGQMFYMDSECWHDLARCLQLGRGR
jgi:hypothetical protein